MQINAVVVNNSKSDFSSVNRVAGTEEIRSTPQKSLKYCNVAVMTSLIIREVTDSTEIDSVFA